MEVNNFQSQGPPPFVEPPLRTSEEIRAFRLVVFRDLLDSEGAHVAEIRGMLENFLEPLAESEL
jgi:Rho guanine nucleotide exchange factor 7